MTPDHKYTKEQIDSINKDFKEKFDNALTDHWFERESSNLNWKRTQKLEEGLYCLNSSSMKLVNLLKELPDKDFESLPNGLLNNYYQEHVNVIESILQHNKHIKELKEYPFLQECLIHLPDGISAILRRPAELQNSQDLAYKLYEKVSRMTKKYGGETCTALLDDEFIVLCRETGEAIDRYKHAKQRIKEQNYTSTPESSDEIQNSDATEERTEMQGFCFYGRTIESQGKEITLPKGTYEFFIFQELFNKPVDARLTDEELREVLIEKKGEPKSSSAVADAIRRLNRDAKEKLDIEELIKKDNSTYWINPLLRNVIPTQPTQL